MNLKLYFTLFSIHKDREYHAASCHIFAKDTVSALNELTDLYGEIRLRSIEEVHPEEGMTLNCDRHRSKEPDVQEKEKPVKQLTNCNNFSPYCALDHCFGSPQRTCFEKIGNDSAPDNVNHPSHYTQGGIECIKAIEASMSPEGFQDYCKGNVLKYIWRFREKNGLEDLKKAQAYLGWLIESVEEHGNG